MQQATVLVLGANGRFGQAAVQGFAGAGWRVLAQVRRAPTTPLPAGAQALTLPLADSAGLLAAAGGASVVVHALNPVYTRWNQDLLPLTRQGMDLAQRLDALFMLPGNVYNFGTRMPAVLHEDTPFQPDHDKASLRCRIEDELQARSALRSVVIRAGDFFGAGRGSWLDLVIAKSIGDGKLVYPGPLDLPHAWAYLPDLAQAFVAVATQRRGDAGMRRLHFGGHTLTGADFLAAVERAAAALGLQPARGWRHGGMPWGLIRAAGLVWPMGRNLATMSYLWRRPHALDGRALEQSVGPLQQTPIDAALRAALCDLGFGSHTDLNSSRPAQPLLGS
jgi:nucleoside-diphosphate-sugar epimerase